MKDKLGEKSWQDVLGLEQKHIVGSSVVFPKILIQEEKLTATLVTILWKAISATSNYI